MRRDSSPRLRRLIPARRARVPGAGSHCRPEGRSLTRTPRGVLGVLNSITPHGRGPCSPWESCMTTSVDHSSMKDRGPQPRKGVDYPTPGTNPKADADPETSAPDTLAEAGSDLEVGLHDYQREAVEFLRTRLQGLLALAVGGGKTRCALVRIDDVTSEEPQGTILVLAPLTMLEHWRRELAHWLPHLTVTALTDLKAGERPDVVLGNWELAHRRASQLSQLPLSLVIVDEVSGLKGGGAYAQTVASLTAQAGRSIGLTATPMEMDPVEPFQMLKALSAPATATEEVESWCSWWDTYNDFGKRVSHTFRDLLPGGRERVTEALRPFLFYRDADAMGLKPPERVGERERPIALTGSQAEHAKRAAKMQGLFGYQQREKAGRIGKDGSSDVAEAALGFLLDRVWTEKAVLYCWSTEVLNFACDWLDAHSIRYVRIDGKTSKKKRVDAVTAFQDDRRIRVLVGSEALQRGVDGLQKVCRLLVSIDGATNPAAMEQIEGRICRQGSPFPTFEHISFIPATDQADDKTIRAAERAARADAVLRPLQPEILSTGEVNPHG